MSRITPLELTQLPPAHAAQIKAASDMMGFVANDGLIMARLPEFMAGFSEMVTAAYSPNWRVSLSLRRLVAIMVSEAAGCQYCSAHTRFGAHRGDVSQAQLDALWAYETSPAFDDGERTALHFARRAALTPPRASDDDFAALRRHFSEDECSEIIAMIALFAFLNKWNSLLKTDLEALPSAHVRR